MLVPTSEGDPCCQTTLFLIYIYEYVPSLAFYEDDMVPLFLRLSLLSLPHMLGSDLQELCSVLYREPAFQMSASGCRL
jgi:hypothetical protein